MGRKLVGKVINVSHQGDLITDITGAQLDTILPGAPVTVSCQEHQTVGILPENHGEPEMTLVAVRTAQDRLELRIVGESAREFLGIPAGAEVVVRW
jgi:hypothetical protein